mmetsp:Transcript_21069/g.49985  ORF Transcript_21069/g.49985 Transcript_21069/m.49985 type:complete len:287 (+) Transcript_21069:1443-2303(+)
MPHRGFDREDDADPLEAVQDPAEGHGRVVRSELREDRKLAPRRPFFPDRETDPPQRRESRQHQHGSQDHEGRQAPDGREGARQPQEDREAEGRRGLSAEISEIPEREGRPDVLPHEAQKDGADGQLLGADAHGDENVEPDAVGPFPHLGVGRRGRPDGFQAVPAVDRIVPVALRWGVPAFRAGWMGPFLSVLGVVVVVVVVNPQSYSLDVLLSLDDRPAVVGRPHRHEKDSKQPEGNPQLADGPREGQDPAPDVSLNEMDHRLAPCRSPLHRIVFDATVDRLLPLV